VTGALAVVGVALVPWLGVILDQITGHPNVNAPLAIDVARAHLPGGSTALVLKDLVGAVFAAANVLNRPYVVFVVAALLAAIPLLRMTGRSVQSDGLKPAPTGNIRIASRQTVEERVVGIAVAVTALAFVVLRVANVTLVLPRHMAGITPGFLLLWSLWIARTPSSARAWVASACLLIVCGLTLASYEHAVDVADSRGAAAYVARQSLTDPVLVIGPEAVFPFRYYYRGRDHGTGAVLGTPIDASVETYAPDAVPLTRAPQIEARLAATGATHRFWVVVSKQYIWKSDTAAAALQAFLRAHAARDSTDFKNLYVVEAQRGG
jgi:hypothetical protein